MPGTKHFLLGIKRGGILPHKDHRIILPKSLPQASPKPLSEHSERRACPPISQVTTRLSEVAPRRGQGRPPAPSPPGAQEAPPASGPNAGAAQARLGSSVRPYPAPDRGHIRQRTRRGRASPNNLAGNFSPKRPVPRSPSQANRARGPQPREVTPSPSR